MTLDLNTTALLVIDIQNDFCSAGSLAVGHAEAIIPVVNDLMGVFKYSVLTQDWHPADHHSFASNHPGYKAYDRINTHYGTQLLWPDHCVQGSHGARFHPDLQVDKAHMILRKGYRQPCDSYSAFFDNDKKTPTGLDGYLKTLSINTVAIAGLATDFCVLWSVCDALRLGYQVVVVEDAVKGIDSEASVAKACEQMVEAGAVIRPSSEISLSDVV